MDPARQSAIAGAVLGLAVVVMGIVIVGIGAGFVPAVVHFPRPLIALEGAGLVFCGAAFATVTRRRRMALLLAIPGAALAFLLPLGWAALSPGKRECTLEFFGAGGASLSEAVPLGEATCAGVLAVAAVAALAVVAGMLVAWRKLPP